MFRNRSEFLLWSVVRPPPNPQAGGQPPVSCPRLLIQYIRSYPPYLKAVSSIRNPRTSLAMVTGDPFIMATKPVTGHSSMFLPTDNKGEAHQVMSANTMSCPSTRSYISASISVFNAHACPVPNVESANGFS
jgi:hypothetical protein